MRKTIAGVFILFFTALQVLSQERGLLSYAASSIHDSLKKDANAVVRLDEGVLDIVSPSKYVLKVHQVVTILNSEGAEHLSHVLGFDKFYKVENIEINVFDNERRQKCCILQKSNSVVKTDDHNIIPFCPELIKQIIAIITKSPCRSILR